MLMWFEQPIPYRDGFIVALEAVDFRNEPQDIACAMFLQRRPKPYKTGSMKVLMLPTGEKFKVASGKKYLRYEPAPVPEFF